ncbi:hypothetical protein BH11BAC4_BH11BAC4_19950 [soil metagenome]
MKNLSATIKGFITGVIMILISIAIYYYRGSFENKLQYITYFVYIAGIIWTLAGYKQSHAEPKTFKTYFAQGFRCFIVVALLMVLFTWVFLMLNPHLKAEMATQYRADLLKQGNYTPAEMDSMVLKAKEYFTTMLISVAIFGYLLIGSLVTLIGSAFLSQKK